MIIIPILAIFGYSFVFSRLFQVKLSNSFLPVFSILGLVLYFAAMIGLIYHMTYFLYLAGIGSLIYSWVKYKSQIIELSREYFHEFTFLLLIVLAFAAHARTSEFASWDDFSHWGLMSKELIQNSAFEYNLSESVLLKSHMHYPRGAAIYHYFMLLLPGYSDGGALFAHFLLHLLLITPLMANKEWYHTMFFIIVIFAAVMYYTTGLRSIYNDSTTSLMFASIFLVYLSESDKSKGLYLALPILIFLPLFREIGFLLSLIAAFILIYLSYKKNDCCRAMPVYVAMLIAPYMVQSVWFWYFSETHQGLARSQHTLSNLWLLIKSFDEQSWLIAKNYVKFMLKFLIKEGSIVVYVLLALSWFGVKKYNKNLTTEWLTIFKLLLVGFLIFSLWRLYLYYAVFAAIEAVQGKSIIRYCGTYSLMFAVIAAYYIKHSTFAEEKISRKEIIIFIFVALAASISVGRNITRVTNKTEPGIVVYNKYIDYVKGLILDGKSVKFSYQNKHNGIDCYKLNYKISPHLSMTELFKCLNKELNLSPDAANLEFSEIKQDGLDDNNSVIIYYPFLNKVEMESEFFEKK
jgi:hypothetical protein